jgi:tetratricopeptide (TPR) repeat protein
LAQGDYQAAQSFFEQSLALKRAVGDKIGIAMSLNSLGIVAYAQGNYTKARTLQEESLALSRELNNKSNMAYVLLGLGLVDLAENNSLAREHILQSLRLRQEMGEQVQQTSSLIGVAGLAWQEGDAQFAVGVLGAADSTLKRLKAVMEPEVLHYYTQMLSAVREQLGAEAFNVAWSQGAQMSLDQVVDQILQSI